MNNKLKVAALVVVVLIGMVVYKKVFDAREEKGKSSPKPKFPEDDLN